MITLLGIDPGSRITGYGLVQAEGNRFHYLASGCIRTTGEDFPRRLHEIFQGLSQIVSEYSPEEVAVEQVFVSRNVSSALKLGQARGAAICACVNAQMPVFEYTPTQVKQALVGTGHADKTQVQHMVQATLQLSSTPQADAADALAIALCHAQIRRTLGQLAQAAGGARGWRR